MMNVFVNYVCIICECPVILGLGDDMGGPSESMGFSESHASPTTDLNVCDNCMSCFIKPHVYYQTYHDVLCTQGAFNGSVNHMFRKGNEINYRTLQKNNT